MLARSWFDALKSRLTRTLIRQQRRASGQKGLAPRRLRLEPLEDRHLLATVFTIGDVTILEGNAGTLSAVVPVTLSGLHGNGVTVNYNTANGTATAGIDYNAVSGKLTFAKGESSKTISVPIIGDRVPEADEFFFVRLSNPKGAKIADGEGIVTIVDNEPRISINDVSALEGNSGTTAFTFTVSLSAAYDQAVTVNYTTADGSATAGSDYTAPTPGTLTFRPGQPTSQTITVLVNGDREFESDETFIVTLSTPNSYAPISRGTGVGTIIEDDPQISIGDAYFYEGYDTSFTFTVTLSAASTEAVTVDFTTVDGTAIAGTDYVTTFGTLTFAPGVTSMTFTVDVLNPTYVDNKYFTVQLSGASTNALIANAGAYGYWSYYYDPGYGGGYYDPGYGYYY